VPGTYESKHSAGHLNRVGPAGEALAGGSLWEQIRRVSLLFSADNQVDSVAAAGSLSDAHAHGVSFLRYLDRRVIFLHGGYLLLEVRCGPSNTNGVADFKGIGEIDGRYPYARIVMRYVADQLLRHRVSLLCGRQPPVFLPWSFLPMMVV